MPAKAGIQAPSRRMLGTILETGSRFSPGTLDSGLRRNEAPFSQLRHSLSRGRERVGVWKKGVQRTERRLTGRMKSCRVHSGIFPVKNKCADAGPHRSPFLKSRGKKFNRSPWNRHGQRAPKPKQSGIAQSNSMVQERMKPHEAVYFNG